jgi:hypothetical protein
MFTTHSVVAHRSKQVKKKEATLLAASFVVVNCYYDPVTTDFVAEACDCNVPLAA